MVMRYPVIETHFEVLKATINDPAGWPDGSPRSWAKWVQEKSGLTLNWCGLPEKANRITLRAMTLDSKVGTDACCIYILAWGGMHRKNGEKLFASGHKWLDLSDEIRNGSYDRAEAYDRFSDMRSRGQLPGMGPAYFTKLIFFLMQDVESRGLIMDQWTSASVNLLSGIDLVKTNHGYFQLRNSKRIFETVSDLNSSKNYDSYCNYVEQLSAPNLLNVHRERAEELLFSEGRGKGRWRNYVVRIRQQSLLKTLET